MDCASLYRYYAGMDIRRFQSRERTKTAEAKAAQEKLTQEIALKEKRLKELQDKPVNLPDVVENRCAIRRMVSVRFSRMITEPCLVHFEKADKKFKYPSVFYPGIFKLCGRRNADRRNGRI